MVKKLGKDETTIRQYQVDGNTRVDEMLLGVARQLGRFEELKEWVINQNKNIHKNGTPTYNLSGITYSLENSYNVKIVRDLKKKESEPKNKKEKKKNYNQEEL